MNKYLISYDLGLPETREDYKKLITKIKGYKTWAKPLKSVWFILSTQKASEIRDELRVFLDYNDSLLVIEVKSHWATSRINEKVTEWMKKNV